MIAKGKFPLSFESSAGTQQVRSLIEAVQEVVEAEIEDKGTPRNNQ